jgi:iron(III) transport system ATP-binding protein
MRQNLNIVSHGEPMVALDQVAVTFGDTVALDRVSLEVGAGEIVCLLGPSGSGKSTLLRAVAGIERTVGGQVTLDGVVVTGPGVFVEPEQRRVGMVFQDYALFPHLTVAANVAFGLKGARSDVNARVAALLERVGLARYAKSYPHMLSGGERQRVALARALAPNPRVLLMDEPFSSLDRGLRDRVRRETVDLLRETRTTTLVVTHDPTEAVLAADRIALLRAGRLLQVATPEELYMRPNSAFAAHFLGEVNELPGTCRGGRVDTVFGSFSAPHVPEHAAARVCIRPQDLRVAGGPTPIKGRVLASEFLGDAERVIVGVPELNAPVAVRTLARTRLNPGDTVHLDVDPSHVVIVPDDGAVTHPVALSEVLR